MHWGHKARRRLPSADAHGSCSPPLPGSQPDRTVSPCPAFLTPARDKQALSTRLGWRSMRQCPPGVQGLGSAPKHVMAGHPVLAGPLLQWMLQGATQAHFMTQTFTHSCR